MAGRSASAVKGAAVSAACVFIVLSTGCNDDRDADILTPPRGIVTKEKDDTCTIYVPAVIRGTVTDGGAQVAGAVVYAKRNYFTTDDDLPVVYSTRTDSSGRYEISVRILKGSLENFEMYVISGNGIYRSGYVDVSGKSAVQYNIDGLDFNP